MQRGSGGEAVGRGSRIADPPPAGILVAPSPSSADAGYDDLRDLDGRPLISWSFDVLRAAGCRPIVVPVGSESAERAARILGRGADVIPASGGRRAALLAALDEIESESVVIHDANRPFATAELVKAVARALGGADAAIAAVPVNETLKLVERDRVAGTVDRRHLWHPQTPQAFRTDVLLRALVGAKVGVSEAEAVRGIGARIALVPGSSKNIRVTSADDLKLAEAIARAR